MNFSDYDIRLLHHSVQSLNSMLLDIAMMLTVDHLNVNILCFTEHWLLDQMNVLNMDLYRLVSNFSRSYTHQEDHVFLQEILFKLKKLIILGV